MPLLKTPALHQLTVDEELSKVGSALGRVELRFLRANLQREGWEPDQYIVVWKETGIILDGLHRYWLCHQLKIPFLVWEMSFPDRDAAEIWARRRLLSPKRNLTPNQRRYLMGAIVNGEGKDKVARETGLHARTLDSAAKFAAAVDKISSKAGPEVKWRIVDDLKLTQRQMDALAKQPVERIKELMEQPLAHVKRVLDRNQPPYKATEAWVTGQEEG
jgi:hypothetical protein